MSIVASLLENKFIILLLLLISFFISTALITDTHFEFLVAYLSVILMTACLYIIGKRRRFIIITAAFLLVMILSLVVSGSIYPSNRDTQISQALLTMIFFLMIMFASLRYTIQDKRIRLNNLCGAVCTYLLLGLAWSYFYVFLDIFDPHAFNTATGIADVRDKPAEFIYYSFVTLTTLGYGDIYPVTDMAKTLSWLQAVAGQIYLTILIAQLVGLYIAQNQNRNN